MGSPGELRLEFQPRELPEWRHGKAMTTSSMVELIVDYCARYENLNEEQKSWASSAFADSAYGEFLFQVNKIEKEGFETYPETQDAISKGALKLAEAENYVSQDDIRLEQLCCLYRALRHWFMASTVSTPPSICIQELEKCHELLLGTTNKDVAGRIRKLVVFVNTEDGVHVFVWPTEVEAALRKLLERTQTTLENINGISCSLGEKVEQLLKLGGSFFLEFENIHPFLDGNGRCGRILLAYILKSIMPFPNVLFVDRAVDYGLPPLVSATYYYACFQDVQIKQEFEVRDGKPVFTKERAVCKVDYPEDLTALIIEGVYVGWKRFFKQLDEVSTSMDQ